MLNRLKANGAIDAAGRRISEEQLKRIRDAAPEADGRPLLGEVNFEGATFEGEAPFHDVVFEREARFRGARFRGRASFESAQFLSGAAFGEPSTSGAKDSTADTASAAEQAASSDEQTSARKRDSDVGGATFERDAVFEGARFKSAPSFRDAHFNGRANFTKVHFGAARKSERTRPGSKAEKPKPACFDEATFKGRATFEDARFYSRAEFGGERGATFGEWADFERVVFMGEAMFGGAEFTGRAMFGGAQVFGGLARFDGATFERARTFGPLRVNGTLILDRARFGGPVRIEVAAVIVSGVRAHFASRATIVIRWADIQLDESQFDAPALVVGASAPFRDAEVGELTEDGVSPAARPRREGASERPRVVSLRWANVGCLTLSHVDLRPCRFLGAHGLDGLRLEHDVEFARTPPRSWRKRERTRSRRRTLAEEHDWRANGRSRRLRKALSNRRWLPKALRWEGWYPTECRPPDWLRDEGGVVYQSRSVRRVAVDPKKGTPAIAPEAVAPLYRALRKSLEDAKDEPGAADFYYGEMEMRRKAGRRKADGEAVLAQRSTSWPERLVLNLYWAVSGYGLRASRALVSLLVTIAVFGVAFQVFGGIECPDPPKGESAADQPCQETIGRGLLLSAESSSSLFRAPDPKRYVLGDAGEGLQLAIRLLGPLFFGLGLLALRGRVKR